MRASLLLLVLLSPQDDSWGNFWVSPTGKDTNAGTQDSPFATLEHARDAAHGTVGKKPVTITLRGGIYFLKEPILFGSEDSGTAEAPGTYRAFPGERPVLSAGRPLTGWKKTENGVWTASATGKFRQLFVDPENGDFTLKPDSPALKLGFEPIDVSKVGPRKSRGAGVAAPRASF
jgi:hypothetical protein